MASKYIEKFASTAALIASAADRSLAFGIGAVSGILYGNVNGAAVALADVSSAQTLTNKTLTAPAISNPVVSGSGQLQVAVVNLDGATWHTGDGTADFLSWTAPAAVVIQRCIVNVATVATGAATADIGTSVVDNHTSGDNLLDAVDIHTATGAFGNILASGVDTEKPQVALAAGGFVNFHALADPTGMVGKAYIFYFTL